MTVKRMEDLGIVMEDIDATIPFSELCLMRRGRAPRFSRSISSYLQVRETPKEPATEMR